MRVGAALVGLVSLLAVPSVVSSDEAALRDVARGIADRSEALRLEGERAGFEALLPGAQELPERPSALMEELFERTRRIAAEAAGVPAEGVVEGGPARARYVMFASFSLGSGVLSSMLDEARARGDAEVVTRGIPDGWSLEQFAGAMISTGSRESVPLAVDPPSFRAFGIDRVPALADRLTGKVVFGTFYPERLELEDDREVVGAVLPIDEPDLIAVMQARAATIDWEEKRRAALARAWGRVEQPRLPKATVDQDRPIDLSIVVGADIVTPDGVTLARAGDRIDPRAHMPFGHTLIVFDAADPAEVAFAAAELERARQPILLATNIEGGFEGLQSVSAVLDWPVYVLSPSFARRWRIERTPSVVVDDGNGVWVRERVVGHAP